jgi:prepilin signal peptidase PulO-like enzyme (type II secretory pathway)
VRAGTSRRDTAREVRLRVALLPIGVGLLFTVLGVAAERLASVWPAEEAARAGWRPRTVILAVAAGLAAWAVASRSTLPWWATAFHLLVLALLVLLTATDWEQRRLPHLALDPLIALCVLFVLFNPTVTPLSALIGGVAGVGFLWVVGLIVRQGVALGDLYLVAPLGLILGWPAIFSAIFIAALAAAGTSIVLLVRGRAAMGSYIPFGPFLVIGAVVTLVREPGLLGAASDLAALLR